MAVQTMKVVVCDCCGKDEPTQRYTVTFPTGSRRTFDLCEGCATTTPLTALQQLAVANGRGPKGHRQPVLTIDEIKAGVDRERRRGNARKRTAAKRGAGKG